MLFDKEQNFQGIESFDPSQCEMEKKKLDAFDKDEIAMGCSEGCWSGCIGSCRRSQH